MGRVSASYRLIGEPVAVARRRLVCFPHAGGSAASFRAWPESLPAGWELWAAELPGHGARRSEPLARRVRDVLPELLADLDPLLDRPTILLGHSLGALLAFELARALATHPRGPLLVVLTAPPDLDAKQEPLHELDDAALLERVRGLGSLDRVATAAPGGARGAIDGELLELALPILRADLEMGEAAEAEGPPLELPLLVFTGLSDPHAPPASAAAWARRARGPFRHYTFPGDHFFPDATLGTLLRFVDEMASEAEAA